MGAASSFFFTSVSGDETLNNRVRPSDDQFAYLRENKDELEDWLVSDMGEQSFKVSTFLQGSYRFHTLIKPISPISQYDVDLGLYFNDEEGSTESTELRDLVQKSLIAYSKQNDEISSVEDAKERCSRLVYKKRFHIDIPVYSENAKTQLVRLATLSKGWERSDPSAMLEWFQQALEGTERAQTRRLVRYLKAWAALKFPEGAERPSSLTLSVLVVGAVRDVVSGEPDDEAFALVVRNVYEKLVLTAVVANPVDTDSDSDINRLSAEANTHFLARLSELVETTERAVQSDDEAEAAVIWCEAFEHLFPLPDVTTLAIEQGVGTGLIIRSPQFSIEVYDKIGGTLQRSYNDNVPQARVGESLKFSIKVPSEVIPAGATVTWVVRNAGREAHAQSDLGHSAADSGAFVHWEHCGYIGKHFLDCEVRLHGRLRSISRISVNINRLAVPLRHPARRPSYRLIGRRNR